MLVLACAAQFMVVLDVSVVNVALPSIQRGLHVREVDLQWVVTGYALTFAGFLLLGGRLADLFGQRRVFLIGLAVFTGASLAGGLAQTPVLLNVARAAQGLGAAVLAPATLTILTTTFSEGPARTRAVAVWTAVGVGGGMAGNLIGGLLTELLSWRSVLLVNVPLGSAAAALAVRFLPSAAASVTGRRLDVAGAFTATAGLVALTYGVTIFPARGMIAPTAVAALTVGALMLALFVVIEARAGEAALIPVRLVRARAVSVGNAAMLLAGASLNPMWFFLALSMQNVLHYSPLRTGLGFLPHAVLTIAVGVLVTPRLMRRVDARTLVVIGALVAAGGFVWQSRLHPGSGYLTGIGGPAVLIAVGGGLLNTPLTTIVTSGVDRADAGAASGLMNTAKQVGGGLGLAALVGFTTSDAAGPQALADGYGHAFLAIGLLLVATAAAAAVLPARRNDLGTPRPVALGRSTRRS